MPGHIYIMKNEDIPGLVKIGMTDRTPAERAQELRNAGNPGQFVVAYSAEVEDPRFVESEAHRNLEAYHHDKEWFRCSVTVAISAVQQAALGSSPRPSSETVWSQPSPGPLASLTPGENAVWGAYFDKERQALENLGRGRDAAERKAWEEHVRAELRAASDERAAAIRRLRSDP